MSATESERRRRELKRQIEHELDARVEQGRPAEDSDPHVVVLVDTVVSALRPWVREQLQAEAEERRRRRSRKKEAPAEK